MSEDRDEREGRSVRRGRISRALSLSKLALGAGRRLVTDRARAVVQGAATAGVLSTAQSVALAEDLLATLSEMKGLAMKLGQMLSYVDDLLPPEARRALVGLQRAARPVPFEEIRRLYIEEQGAPPEERLVDFDPEPFAAASIGQVHRARLPDGTEVAVKIQYPGIAEAMAADLKNARVLSLFQRVFFFRTDTTAIMAELEERLLGECDYLLEADYQERFRQRFEGHPVIRVPEVHRDYSSRRVLTTTYFEGLSFYEWLAKDPGEEARHLAMATFYRFYLGSLYLDGYFNCDPHPGNYLFLDNGQILFLDYGCTRPFPEERRLLWVAMCRAVVDGDVPRVHELGRAIGFIPEGVDDYDREAFYRLMRYLYLAYLEDRPYDFREHPPQRTMREMFLDNPNLFRMDMPPDAVFLNRITFGLVSLLTELGSAVNVRRRSAAYFEGRDPDWPEDPVLSAGSASRETADEDL